MICNVLGKLVDPNRTKPTNCLDLSYTAHLSQHTSNKNVSTAIISIDNENLIFAGRAVNASEATREVE